MRETLEKHPNDFWYFNNGVTIVARRADRAMAGGSDNDFATFHCEDVSIVNGAQTVGTLGKAGEIDLSKLDAISVPVRIIVRGDDQSFAESVTKSNNRQNRIDGRDFVALDQEQIRIRTELAIDGIDYQIMRTDSFTRTATSFDFVEAATALACASVKVRLVVQLKREIGKLWDDIGKSPYKELFNESVPGLHVWRCVQIQRRVDKALDSYYKRVGNQNYYAIGTHGNRLVSAMVFRNLPIGSFRSPNFDIEKCASENLVTAFTDAALVALADTFDENYPNSIIPTLFKNQKKCEHLFTESVKLSSRTGTGT